MTTADRFDPDSYRLSWKRTLEGADASTQTIPRVVDNIYVGRHRSRRQTRRFSFTALFHIARHRA